jgi:glucose-1-phosphate thymidylyltransferase
MIYGLIPVGGKGTRLGLPYSKEMLPQKNFYHFNPVCNHIVKKMELAGASKIYFVHGFEFKKDLKEFFNESNYIHILQNTIGFANVIKDFYDEVKDLKDEDRIIFGLPDSIFNENPFVEMLNKKGIVCGLFTTNKISKVDRLEIKQNKFQIKVSKNDGNKDQFWGILKFDGLCIKKMIQDKVFDKFNEIGEILNLYNFDYVIGNSYLDIGTWQNYNRYLTDTKNFSNFEIEKKYEADKVDLEMFIKFASIGCESQTEITSTDHYYTINNTNIEFVRYREDNDPNNKSIPDITIKNFDKTQLNRFELSMKLNDTKPHNVMHFLNLIGCKFEFSVTKHCYIFYHKDYSLVYYSFLLNNKKIKIIEIELNKIDFNIINQFEEQMCHVDGFDPDNTIIKSKFQLIKESK